MLLFPRGELPTNASEASLTSRAFGIEAPSISSRPAASSRREFAECISPPHAEQQWGSQSFPLFWTPPFSQVAATAFAIKAPLASGRRGGAAAYGQGPAATPHHGATVLWCHGAVVSRVCRVVVPRCHGVWGSKGLGRLAMLVACGRRASARWWEGGRILFCRATQVPGCFRRSRGQADTLIARSILTAFSPSALPIRLFSTSWEGLVPHGRSQNPFRETSSPGRSGRVAVTTGPWEERPSAGHGDFGDPDPRCGHLAGNGPASESPSAGRRLSEASALGDDPGTLGIFRGRRDPRSPSPPTRNPSGRLNFVRESTPCAPVCGVEGGKFARQEA